MEHVHSSGPVQEDVQENMATRLLGITLGLLSAAALVGLHQAWHWHWSAFACVAAALGVTMGAGASSAYGGARASFFAWAGVTLFLCGLLMFFGVAAMIFGK